MFNIASSLMASTVRGWKGTSSVVRKKQPESPIQLYDIEACPYCRPVRECLTALDLDVHVYPCPKGSVQHLNTVEELGGKRQVPFLYDENTGECLYESADIVAYLHKNYGSEQEGAPKSSSVMVSSLASVVRLGAGFHYRSSQQPKQPLELFSFESSPFSRPVRETLSEMGIAYILRSGGKQQRSDMGAPGFRLTLKSYHPIEGTTRDELLSRTGRVQFPYLFDPNTETGLFESSDIVKYLKSTYAN